MDKSTIAYFWIKQSEHSLLDQSWGSTVLIKFKRGYDGITIDDGNTVDLSWMRVGLGKIVATTGEYSIEDIVEWACL